MQRPWRGQEGREKQRKEGKIDQVPFPTLPPRIAPFSSSPPPYPNVLLMADMLIEVAKGAIGRLDPSLTNPTEDYLAVAVDDRRSLVLMLVFQLQRCGKGLVVASILQVQGGSAVLGGGHRDGRGPGRALLV